MNNVEITQTTGTTQRKISIVAWGWLGLGLILFGLGYWWRASFAFGDASGAYWLLITYDYLAPALALLTVLVVIPVLVVGGLWAVRYKRLSKQLLGAAAALILSGVAFAAASFPAIVSPWRAIDQVQVDDGRVYHLAYTTALIDLNYGLFSCDGSSANCRQIFRSEDFSLDSPTALTLVYDPDQQALMAQDEHGAVLFIHVLFGPPMQ